LVTYVRKEVYEKENEKENEKEVLSVNSLIEMVV